MPQDIENGLGVENELEAIAMRIAAVKIDEALKDPATLAEALRDVGHDDLAQELEVREGLAQRPEPLGGEPELADQAKSIFRSLGYRPVGG